MMANHLGMISSNQVSDNDADIKENGHDNRNPEE
jgi:hypothetical protein